MKHIIVLPLAGLFLIFSSIHGEHQKVPFEVCNLKYDTTSCFFVDDATPVKVGEHVTTLDESFRFCLNDKIYTGAPPIQVVFAIDVSGSMRENDPNNMRTEAAHNFVAELRKRSSGSYVSSFTFSGHVEIRWNFQLPVKLSDSITYGSLWDAIEGSSNSPKPRPAVLPKTLATSQGLAFAAALDLLLALRADVPGMRQHVIMITDDGWYEKGDIMPDAILSTYSSRFPGNAFPQVHTVVLTGDGNPKDKGMQGLENIKLIADKTKGFYIEDATPQTIVATLSNILQSLTPRMDKLQAVNMKNLTTGESHAMKFDSIPGSKNDYIISGSSWKLANGENSFVIEQSIFMHDSTTRVINDTLHLIRSAETVRDSISTSSSLVCAIEWPEASFTATPDSVLVKESVNAKVQIDPSFKFPYDIENVSVKGFTVSSPNDSAIVSLFHLDSNILDAKRPGTPGEGNPGFNKERGAFGGCMNEGSFRTTIPFSGNNFSFDFWVHSEGRGSQTLIMSNAFSLSLNQDGSVLFTSGSQKITSTNKVFDNVWSNIAVVKNDGKISLYINGLNSSDAQTVNMSGEQLLTVSTGSGVSIDELRFNTTAKIYSTPFGNAYSVSQVSGINWTMNGKTETADAITVPSGSWSNNAINFTITRNSRTQLILNMTRLNSRMSWTLNSNPVEFTSRFPDPVPFIAEVLDGNGNGFIDRIMFKIESQDTSKLSNSMPDVGAYIKTLKLITFDDKDILLQPKAIERVDGTTFMVILNEHSGTVFETGWKSVDFSTHNVSVVTSGAFTNITKVIDKAGPVIARAEFFYGREGKKEDTLKIKFSEPVVSSGASPSAVFNYYQREKLSLDAFKSIDAGSFTLSSDRLTGTVIMTNGFVVLPHYDSLQLKNAPDLVDSEGNSAHETSRIAAIEGKVRFTITVKPVVNPYVKGTEIPEAFLGRYSDVLKDGNKNVVLVAIKSTLPLAAMSDGLYGSVSIYDGVGNLVQRNIPVYQANAPTDYGFTWNVKNMQQRNVNQGVYLAIVKVQDLFQTQHVFKEKIGIK